MPGEIREQPRQSPIRGFRGFYSFLSNFYVEEDGTTVEAEYQAAKCKTPSESDIKRTLFYKMGPAMARVLGNQIELRSDWEKVKKTIMKRRVKQKFRDHADLRRLLLDTGERELVETNTWRDRYWGVYNGKGENHLGKILMEVRRELRLELEQ